MGNTYNIVAEAPESTVVAEFTPAKIRSDSYQSEADLDFRKEKLSLPAEEMSAVADSINKEYEKLV